MSQCDCPKPDRPFFCERHGVTKTVVLWQKCQEGGPFWVAWDEGRGPGQPKKPLTREQELVNSAKVIALYESLCPIAERLAAETGEPHIVPNALQYGPALKKWKKAGFPVRDQTMQKAITEKMCPGCCRYRNGTCGRCNGRGQLIVALAWMDTARCPARIWELW